MKTAKKESWQEFGEAVEKANKGSQKLFFEKPKTLRSNSIKQAKRRKNNRRRERQNVAMERIF